MCHYSMNVWMYFVLKLKAVATSVYNSENNEKVVGKIK